jgi:hypothetical protein
VRGAVRWLVAALALLPGRAVPRELWSEGDHSVALVTALKSSALVTRAPYDPTLFPDPTSAEGLWQLRLDLEGRLPASLRAGAAWQTGLGVTSAGAGLAGLSGILPGRAPVAYRIWQLSWPIAEELPYLSWTQEIDRLWVSAEAGPLRVTAGRQAVGWGRGVLFGAVDIFAPFPALQADREWRAGVDAVRVDVKLGQHLAVDAVGAFGPTLDGSAFGARVRGYLGDVDGEVVVGWRARDPFAGLTASAAVGDVEVHAELAVFRTPDPWPGGMGADQRIAPMAVAGASYRIPAGKGIYLLAEYYHSGFGFESARAVIPSLADPGVRERLLRGDTQTLGRDTAALILSYEATEELTATLTVLESLQDGSGIAAPGATVRLGNRVAVSAALYPSWGARPAGGSLGSFWGTAPMAGYVQVAVYD